MPAAGESSVVSSPTDTTEPVSACAMAGARELYVCVTLGLLEQRLRRLPLPPAVPRQAW